MNMQLISRFTLALLLTACASASAFAGTKHVTPPPATPAASAAPDQPRTTEQVVDRIISNEERLYSQIRNYSPLVETYIQNLKGDKDLGRAPAGDHYFIGRANFDKGVNLVPLNDTTSKTKKILGSFGSFFSMQFMPQGFLQMIFIDTKSFDKQRYKFDYVRREFLGEVRCLVFDVTPAGKSGGGLFKGRIWVEDQDYNIVRFKGSYTGPAPSSGLSHF